MARLPVGTYIKFIDANGVDVGFYMQNFHTGTNRFYKGQTYLFGNFAFSGTTVDANASSVTASIVVGLTDLTLATFINAVRQRWLTIVDTVWLDPDTLDERNLWLTETYAITSLSHDNSRINLQLGSPLDAITAQFPRRVLTKAMVGALPAGPVSF